VHADIRCEDHKLPRAAAENVYRVIQEALTNVTKHAQVNEVFVELAADDERVAVTVRDEGCGFIQSGARSGRIGLLGMRERIQLLGGSMVVRSAPGTGTRIDVDIPLSRAASGNSNGLFVAG
jgi:signal transduction histidine kinase